MRHHVVLRLAIVSSAASACVLALAGCSGGTFEVATTDDAGAETSVGPDAPFDGGLEASVDSDALAADSGADGGLDAQPDATPSDATPSDATPDATDAAPVCLYGTKKCDGNQPLTCDPTGVFVDNGGLCNYFCDGYSHQCSCKTTGRFTITHVIINGEYSSTLNLVDAKTGRTWFFRNTAPLSTLGGCYPSDPDHDCHNITPTGIGHVPTVDDLRDLLAQFPPDVSCPGFDGDPILQTFGFTAEPWMTKTPSGLPVGQPQCETVDLSDGTLGPPMGGGQTVCWM